MRDRAAGMAVGNGVMDEALLEGITKALYLYKIGVAPSPLLPSPSPLCPAGATSQTQWDAILAACRDGGPSPVWGPPWACKGGWWGGGEVWANVREPLPFSNQAGHHTTQFTALRH